MDKLKQNWFYCSPISYNNKEMRDTNAIETTRDVAELEEAAGVVSQTKSDPITAPAEFKSRDKKLRT
jgi:hypothetical protein